MTESKDMNGGDKMLEETSFEGFIFTMTCVSYFKVNCPQGTLYFGEGGKLLSDNLMQQSWPLLLARKLMFVTMMDGFLGFYLYM